VEEWEVGNDLAVVIVEGLASVFESDQLPVLAAHERAVGEDDARRHRRPAKKNKK
jgi:hypothetical protein